MPERFVDVAHEALIRGWPRLQRWLDEDRAGLRLHHRITETAEEWQGANRDDDLLYRGARLVQAQEWRERHETELNPLEREFLNASVALKRRLEEREREQQQRELQAAQNLAEAERRRAEEQIKGRKRQRSLIYWLAALLVGTFVVAGVAIRARQVALAAKRETERQLNLSIAGNLTGYALKSLAADPERSVLLALEAASASYLANKTLTSEAEDALHRALQASRVRLTLSDHHGPVASVAYSPDGRRVATSDSARVQIWDAVSGRPMGPAHTGQALGIAFSPDGAYLAATGQDSIVRLWEVASGREVRAFSGHTAFLWSVAFSPDGKRLAAASEDGTVSVWDATSGKRFNTLSGHNGPVWCVVFSPDGKRLASASKDATAKIWDSSSGRELLTLSLPGTVGLAFSPDGKRLATASDDTAVKIWDTVSGRELLSLEGNTSYVFGVAYSHDGKRIAGAGRDKSVRVWDAASGKPELTFLGHTDSVYRVAFSPDGERLLSASVDSTAKLWDLTSSSELPTLSGHTGDVRHVAFSPDGAHVATASSDTTARIWEVDTGKELRALNHEAAVNGVAFSPDGKRLATASADRSARVWDVAAGRQVFALSGHQAEVNGVAFSPDGRLLATASSDRTARLWDAATGRALSSFVGHSGKVVSVDFNPDGSRLVTSGQVERRGTTGTIKVWDVVSRRRLLDLHGDFYRVSRAVFSSDGKHVATAGETDPFPVKLWDADSGKELLTLSGHVASVRSVALSPDGRRVASSGDYGAAKIWDAGTGRELFALSGDQTYINAIVFSPNGRRLATARGDGTVRMYVMDPDDLIALVASRITRPLTLEECKQYLRAQDCSQKASSLVWVGKESLRFGDLEAATAKFRGALDRSRTPDSGTKAKMTTVDLLLMDGRERAGLADVEGATASLEQARRLNSSLNFEPRTEARRIAAIGLAAEGERLASLKRAPEAIELLERAVILDSSNDRAYSALGRIHSDTGAYDKAIASFAKAAEIHRTVHTYTELGDTYRLKKDYEQARKQLKTAISLDPESEWPRRVLGRTLCDAGEYAEAIAQLNEAIKITPTKWGYIDLASTYRQQSDYVHALESISKAKSIDPNYDEAYRSAGLIQHDDLLNFEAAYQEFRKALEVGFSDETDKANFAEAALTSGRFKEARLLASELIRAPGSTTERSLRGQLAMRFIVAASLLLDGELNPGTEKLNELRDYYKTLPVGFDQSWSYRGTRNFIMQYPMNQASRTKLIGALEMIEKEEKAARTPAADSP